MAWVTQGKVNNPTAGLVLADTGAVGSAGPVSGNIVIWTDTSAFVTLRRRNATNTADIATQQLYINGQNLFFMPAVTITLAVNERVQITNDNAFTGTIQASLIS